MTGGILRPLYKVFNWLDSDKNKAIEPADVRISYKSMDRNSNGRIERAELLTEEMNEALYQLCLQSAIIDHSGWASASAGRQLSHTFEKRTVTKQSAEDMYDIFDMNLDGTVHYFEFYQLFSQMDKDKDFSVSPKELTRWLINNQDTICRPYEATISNVFGERPAPTIRQFMPLNEYKRACKQLFKLNDKNENRKLNFEEF